MFPCNILAIRHTLNIACRSQSYENQTWEKKFEFLALFDSLVNGDFSTISSYERIFKFIFPTC